MVKRSSFSEFASIAGHDIFTLVYKRAAYGSSRSKLFVFFTLIIEKSERMLS